MKARLVSLAGGQNKPSTLSRYRKTAKGRAAQKLAWSRWYSVAANRARCLARAKRHDAEHATERRVYKRIWIKTKRREERNA